MEDAYFSSSLGVKQIDLYQLHWPNRRVPISETMKAMEELVKEGKMKIAKTSMTRNLTTIQISTSEYAI